MDIKKLLDEKLSKNNFSSSFNKENNILRYTDKKSGKGVNLDLNILQSQFDKNRESAAIEISYYVEQSLIASAQELSLIGNKNQIFPVIRASSFPKVNSNGIEFVMKEHTAETVIYYALDIGSSYRLIDQSFFAEAGMTVEELHEQAISNLAEIPYSFKKEHLAGNEFYFLNKNDGYDASRILLISVFDLMETSFTGTMAVAIPHQDVLILCDIKNDYGYSILSEMNMKFFTNGHVPITFLSFIYHKNELEPIYIMK
ncbi:MAG: hypothetical protein K0R18_1351 [Bacillales bacterium]|jgi:uncharacterized protein YtpQ (UPF0354 family)|nr:hypothetical protein [Bacillales bacterium]